MGTPTITREDLEAAVPDTSKPLAVDGLDATIQIFRDAYGVPHVRAQSVHDAFFGQGFATAQDRLWQMDYDRRRAYGRWAEYAGEVAAQQDVTMRRFQLLASVRADYAAVNHETKAMLDAYAAGVNALIRSDDSPPIEYTLVQAEPERWEPWDCLAVFKVRHVLMGMVEAKLWRTRLISKLGAKRAAEVLPGYQPGHLLIVPPGAEHAGPVRDAEAELSAGAAAVSFLSTADAGSNNWAVSGSRTASGKPLVAGDPHRPLDTPNVYYQNHMACPEFDAMGLSFPGCPGFPHFGHNASVAWCVTHAQADYQDLYIERFKKGSPAEYEFKGEWKRAEVRHEVIEFRGGGAIETDVTITDHGPSILGEPASGYAAAFKYTATAGPNRGFECLIRQLRVGSADEIEEAMRDWVDACHNFVFADVHGDIGYLTRGKLPVRPRANGWLPVPGWTGEHEWQGFVPFEEMPRSRNPETGYIVTANNKIVSDDYPHYISLDYSPEFRARRITERLKDLDRATVDDMASVHGEKISIPAQVYSRLLSRVTPLDDASAQAIAKLSGWDGEMDRGAVAPAIYSAFRLHLNRRLTKHLLDPLGEEALSATGRGAPFHLRQLEAQLVSRAADGDTSVLPPGTDWSTLMAEALAEGVAYLRDRLGEDMEAWTWGKVHSTRPRHTLSEPFPDAAALLDPPSVPMGGDGDTPHSASYSPSDPFTVVGTSIARYVFDLSDWDRSAWIIPLGASGHPGSPHYADQAPLWRELKLVPMMYDWDRIAARAEGWQELRR